VGGTDGHTGATGGTTITVGKGSTVTLGTSALGISSDAGSSIVVTGDTADSTSAGAYGFVTVNNARDTGGVANTGTKLVFFGSTATDTSVGIVDTASATNLSGALDMLASQVGGNTTNHYYGATQYGGNTWVLEHTGAAGTGLAATDILVKVVGVMDLAFFAVSGAGVIL